MSSDGNDRHALERILSRAATDPEFRRGLLTDPRAAIRDAFGITIPNTLRIKFIERGSDVDALVVLPDMKSEDHALSDSELEQVSGGADLSDGFWTDVSKAQDDGGDAGFVQW
ncbi:MAG: NHLP leader peptide family RiPP precursor [Gemmatimonadaceae bacterium]